MKTYVISEELGPEYFLREAKPGEDLSGKKTIKLADDDFADYEVSLASFEHWQTLLRDKVKTG